MIGCEIISRARMGALVRAAATKKGFSPAPTGAPAGLPAGSSRRAAIAPHAANAMPPSSAGTRIAMSFQVGAGTPQSDTHSEMLVLIQIDQSKQITEKVPMMHSVCKAI